MTARRRSWTSTARGSLEMRYLNGPTGDLVDTVIARESAGGTIAWYLPDRLGTIRDLINNSGSIIDHVDYSAFGTVLDESSPTNGDRMMGFAGMERDTVTGLNLAVNRVQNPGTGRWTSQDPLGFAAGDADLYRYVGNAPTNATDPTGLSDDDRPPAVILPPIPTDPTKPPGPGWVWQGPDQPGGPKGGWKGPDGGSLHSGPNPHKHIGPHWDYTDQCGNKYRYDPKTDTWHPDKNNNPNKPTPNYPNPPGPPDGYPPNPNGGSLPWWVPANPNDDWKYNTVTVVGAPL